MPTADQLLSLTPDLPALVTDQPSMADADVLVVGLRGAKDAVSAVATGVHDASLNEITAAAQQIGAKADIGTTAMLPLRIDGLPGLIITTGLGADEAANSATSAEDFRRAAGAAGRAARGKGTVLFALAPSESAAEVCLGALLGGYRPTTVSAAAADERGGDHYAVVGATAAHVERALAIARAVGHARDFVNTPPNVLYPESFATRAADLAERAGLHTEILDAEALRAGGYGGILGVGGGSLREPRLLRLSHKVGGDRPTVALVGKGITFDTGGISIKPAAGMEQMTMDMGGAAAVIGTMLAVADLDLDLNVVATVPMAENMPDGASYRPGDVLTMYSGTTVEITNTDAEGRLILADAITRACEDKPDYLIDTATLTGAAMVALGKRTPGLMGTAEFRDRIAPISQEIGEDAWPMPLPEDLREGLKSTVADMVNAASGRWGGMLTAAQFLQHFVAEDVQWAHIDVAGPAYNDGSAFGYLPARGTGVPLRTMLATLEDIAAQG